MLQLNEEFEKRKWISIPETTFIIKYKFETGYLVVISDLTHVYEEKMSEAEVQKRFSILYPYVEMKTKVIMKHLEKCLNDHLIHNKNTIILKSCDDKLNLELKFDIEEVPFWFEMKLNLLPAEKMFEYIVAPLVLNASAYHKKYFETRKTDKKGEGLHHDSSLLSVKKSGKSVLFDPECVPTNNVNVESIVKAFLEVEEQYFAARLAAFEESEKDQSSMSDEAPAAQTDKKNKRLYACCKKEINSSDSSSSLIKFENNEHNASQSVKLEQEESKVKQEGRKVKKKKINI